MQEFIYHPQETRKKRNRCSESETDPGPVSWSENAPAASSSELFLRSKVYMKRKDAILRPHGLYSAWHTNSQSPTRFLLSAAPDDRRSHKGELSLHFTTNHTNRIISQQVSPGVWLKNWLKVSALRVSVQAGAGRTPSRCWRWCWCREAGSPWRRPRTPPCSCRPSSRSDVSSPTCWTWRETKLGWLTQTTNVFNSNDLTNRHNVAHNDILLFQESVIIHWTSLEIWIVDANISISNMFSIEMLC